MSSDERNFDVPVVVDRREFFDQEAMFADDVEPVQPYLEPADPIEELKKMREEAEKRTSS